MRSSETDGKSHCSFVMVRARVAPLKAISIPRLELQATVMGARLAEYIRKYILVDSVTLWSDSKTVLSWIW